MNSDYRPDIDGLCAPAQRIIIVISSLRGGGAERVVVDLCEYLISQGRDITVLTLTGNDPDAYELTRSVGRERMKFRQDAHSLPQLVEREWNRLSRMRARIVALNPDVVLSFIDATNVRVLACLIGTSIPVIVSERIHPEHHAIGRKWEWLRRAFYRLASATVVQTRDIARWFELHVPTKRLVVIPNAVRGPSFGKENLCGKSDHIILAIGRLAPQKGFDLLIKAFAQSNLSALGWRVVILGEGESRKDLEHLAADLGVSSYVDMPGHVQNVASWIAAASIFALSSRYEGFSNALLEAMQMSRACVAFDCPGGAKEMIQDNVNGIIIPQGDVDSMCKAFTKLAANSSLRANLGREAANISIMFSPERIYQKWLDTLDDVSVPRSTIASRTVAPDADLKCSK